MVIRAIENIQNRELLTWVSIAAKVGHAERSLRRIDLIYEAFWTKKDTLETPGSTRRRRSKKDMENDTIAYLRRQLEAKANIIKARDSSINLLRQAFVQLIVNGRREGIDVERLWTVAIEKVATDRI